MIFNKDLKQTDLDLDSADAIIDFDLPDGASLLLLKYFYNHNEADQLFSVLLSTLSWQVEKLFIFGKWAEVPRLTCWYGDSDAGYRYSGVFHQPLAWTPELMAIKTRLEQQCQCSFNSVLANLYRDGQDSMGCHADDEKELGSQPTIASVSLGEERLFKLHHKTTKQRLSINLQHGDLLIMGGTCQRHWLHSVPKTKTHKTARINLTFRNILSN